MYPAYKMCRNNDGAEIDGLANPRLAQVGNYHMRERQPLMLAIRPFYICRQEPPLKDFLQQLMEANAETRIETLGEVMGILWKRERKVE